MGCKSSKDAVKPSKPLKSALKSDKDLDIKTLKTDQFLAAKKHFEKGDYIEAIQNYQDACDLDLISSRHETDFVFDCRKQLTITYQVSSTNHTRVLLFLFRQLDTLSWRNLDERGKRSKDLMAMYRDIAKLFFLRKKFLKAILYVYMAQAYGDNETKLRDEISSLMTDDEKKRVRVLQDDLGVLVKYMREGGYENDTIAGVYVKLGRRLCDGKRCSEALVFFKLALDYYTTNNFNGGECLNELGLVYLEMAKAFRGRNKNIKAWLLLYLAQYYFTDTYQEEFLDEAQTLGDRTFSIAQLDQELVRAFDIELRMFQSEIKAHKVETDDVYRGFFNLANELINHFLYKEALIYLNRCLDYYSLKNAKDMSGREMLANVYILISKAFRKKKEPIKAQFYMERGVPLMDEAQLVDTIPAIMSTYEELKEARIRYIIPRYIKNALEKPRGRVSLEASPQKIKAIEPEQYLDNRI